MLAVGDQRRARLHGERAHDLEAGGAFDRKGRAGLHGDVSVFGKLRIDREVVCDDKVRIGGKGGGRAPKQQRRAEENTQEFFHPGILLFQVIISIAKNGVKCNASKRMHEAHPQIFPPRFAPIAGILSEKRKRELEL